MRLREGKEKRTMMKKKVLVWETLATVSGGQKMTLTVMDMLSDKFEFCCLIPAEGMLSEELKARGIPYVLMGDQTLPTGVKGKTVFFRYGWLSVKNIIKSLRAIHNYKPDLLYCPGPAALPWSAICGTFSHRPVVWHLHHLFLDGATKKLLNLCGKFKSVKKIVAVSNCVGDQITNSAAHQKIEVLYNPVDAEKYANGDADRIISEIERTMERKVNPESTLILTHIGAITKNKCQDMFVRTIHEIRRRGYDVIGLLIGDIITEDDRSYKQAIDSYIIDNDLTKNIYEPGFRRDISDILAATHCVIVPSSEGFPLTVLEAMSAKRSVVGKDTGGSNEIIMTAKCGVTFISNGTEKDIADAVEKALQQNDMELQRGVHFCEKLNYEYYKTGIRKAMEIV